MSRSFKKHPGWCDRNPWAKKLASQKVRRTKHHANGGWFKKVFDSYNIHDYKTIVWSNEDLRNYLWYENPRQYYRSYWRRQPREIPCLKELQKTRMYLEARMK